MIMRSVNCQSWRTALAGLGLLSLGSVGAALVVLLITQGTQATAAAAGIIGVVLGLPAMMIAMRRWAHQNTQATADQVEQARESLAGWVLDQWRHEALARSLGDPQPMPVQWRLTKHAMIDCHRAISADDSAFTGRSDQISSLTEQFRRLLPRRLIILGAPGSGKTTLAVQLLLKLIATRQDGEPIPVLVSLAGWDPTTRPRLHSWLAERLAEDYPSLRAFGSDVARALAEQGHILPILDGLDELPEIRRPDVITALNASLTDTDQLVLTSRLQEYATAIAEARMVLTAAAVIEAEPLSPAQAADYLAACLPREPGASWREVLDRLRTGTTQHLATAVATPLGLWLLRTVYLTARADPHPLLTSEVASGAATLQAHLFDQLIPAALTARPASGNPHEPFRPRRSWDPIEVRSWLAYLAQHLDQIGTRDLLWWHLPRYTFTSRAFRLRAGLVVGLMTTLVSGLVSTLQTGWATGLGFGLMSGLTFGLITGLGAGLITDLGAGLRTGHGLKAGLKVGLMFGIMFGLLAGLVFGLETGLGFGLNAGLNEGLESGLGFGLAAGLAAGLRVGLVSGMGGPDWLTGEPTYANLQLKNRTGMLIRDLGIGLIAGLGIGLIAGLGVGLIFGLGAGLMTGLRIGLVAGLVAGLGAGLVKWMGTPSRTGWANTPRSTYKATRTLTVIQVFIGVLAYGLIAGLATGLEFGGLGYGLVGGLVTGLEYGLGPGLMFGLGLISSGAWFSYLLTSCRLAAAKKLPLRLMDFLDDAYRLGLLRTIGPAYQFRHAEFQDHLIRATTRGATHAARTSGL
jgi:NACHT domain